MIRKQARDLCGRDIGRTVRVMRGADKITGSLLVFATDIRGVDLIVRADALAPSITVELDPADVVEVTGSEQG